MAFCLWKNHHQYASFNLQEDESKSSGVIPKSIAEKKYKLFSTVAHKCKCYYQCKRRSQQLTSDHHKLTASKVIANQLIANQLTFSRLIAGSTGYQVAFRVAISSLRREIDY